MRKREAGRNGWRGTAALLYPGPQQAARSGLEQLFPAAQPAPQMALGPGRIVPQQAFGQVPRQFHQVGVHFQVGVAQQGYAALAGADELAGAAIRSIPPAFTLDFPRVSSCRTA